MSRVAILPFPGDPFLLNYWLHYYDNVWKKEVDTLIVYINSPIENTVVEYMQARIERSGGLWFYSPVQLEHGEVINRCLELTNSEDYVVLLEDDCFIFKPSVLNRCFEALESGVCELVGSKRGSCSQEILDKAQERWGLSYAGFGDQGCNFWPNLLFAKNSTLLTHTSRNFGAKTWKRGEMVVPLGYIVEPEVVVGDTFVEASLELRSKIPEAHIGYIPQYHAHPLDIEHYNKGEGIFERDNNGNYVATHVHIGSLSSGVGGVLKDDQNRSLSRRMIDPPAGTPQFGQEPNNDFESQEWERRVQMWLTFWQCREEAYIEDFAKLYETALNQIIKRFSLSRDRIGTRQRLFNNLGLWQK
jgi:hypothetical protein